jgi:hypothetical protein
LAFAADDKLPFFTWADARALAFRAWALSGIGYAPRPALPPGFVCPTLLGKPKVPFDIDFLAFVVSRAMSTVSAVVVVAVVSGQWPIRVGAGAIHAQSRRDITVFRLFYDAIKGVRAADIRDTPPIRRTTAHTPVRRNTARVSQFFLRKKGERVL